MTLRRIEFFCTLVVVLLLASGHVSAEYCLNYSSGVKSLARQSGSSSSRGCVANESECKSALMSNPRDYSGSCYYVPGMYPPTLGATAKGASSVDQSEKANALAQKKIAEQKKSEADYQSALAQQAKNSLLANGIMGVSTSKGMSIKIPAPITSGSSRNQLDCVTRSSASAARGEKAGLGAEVLGDEHHADFESSTDCRALMPNPPPVSAPAPVLETEIPNSREQIAQFLAALVGRMQQTKQVLANQDQQIDTLRAEVAREEQAPVKLDLKTAQPVQSDALRKAREALNKAQADRRQTALDLEKMQQQEREARSRESSP